MTSHDFELLLRETHGLVTNGGRNALEANGFASPSVQEFSLLSHRALRVFRRGCHYGFEQAQRKVATAVIAIEIERRRLIKELAEAKRGGDTATIKQVSSLLSILAWREALLRQVIDEIFLHVLAGKEWVLRRLSLYEGQRSVDPDTLAQTFKEASSRNKADRDSFHLIVDLTSGIHVGDLIRIGYPNAEHEEQLWSVIELKSGTMNERLRQLIDTADENAAIPEIEAAAEAKYGAPARKQVRRMLRQARRQRHVEELIATDRGIDPVLEVPITLHDAPGNTDDFFSVVRDLSENLHTNMVAEATIEGCVQLLGIRGYAVERYGRSIVDHYFYHLMPARKECLLRDPTLRQTELENLKNPPVYHDLVEVNVFSGWSRTFLSWPLDNERLMDLAMRRQLIYAHLDYGQIFEAASKRGLQMEWIPSDLKGVKGQERSHLERMSFPIPGSPNSRGVWVTDSEGNRATFMSGFFARLLVEQMRPSYWLKLVERTFRRPKR